MLLGQSIKGYRGYYGQNLMFSVFSFYSVLFMYHDHSQNMLHCFIMKISRNVCFRFSHKLFWGTFSTCFFDDEYHLNIYLCWKFAKLIFNLSMMWPISMMSYSFFKARFMQFDFFSSNVLCTN